MAKLNASGGYVWSVPIGDNGPDYQTVDSVAVDSLGRARSGGQYSGTIKLFGATFTATGLNDLFYHQARCWWRL